MNVLTTNKFSFVIGPLVLELSYCLSISLYVIASNFFNDYNKF